MQPWALQALEEIESKVAPENVLVYGSQVRNEETEQSDLDLICFDRNDYLLANEISANWKNRGRIVSVQFCDRAVYEKSPRPFWRTIRREARPIKSVLKLCN